MMFKISKKAKDLTMYLMGIGVLALIIGFFLIHIEHGQLYYLIHTFF